MKPAIAITLVVSVLLAATTATAQAQRSHIAPHVGYKIPGGTFCSGSNRAAG